MIPCGKDGEAVIFSDDGCSGCRISRSAYPPTRGPGLEGASQRSSNMRKSWTKFGAILIGGSEANNPGSLSATGSGPNRLAFILTRAAFATARLGPLDVLQAPT